MNLEYCYCASHTGELPPAYAETLGLNTCRVLGRHFRPILGKGVSGKGSWHSSWVIAWAGDMAIPGKVWVMSRRQSGEGGFRVKN